VVGQEGPASSGDLRGLGYPLLVLGVRILFSEDAQDPRAMVDFSAGRAERGSQPPPGLDSSQGPECGGWLDTLGVGHDLLLSGLTWPGGCFTSRPASSARN